MHSFLNTFTSNQLTQSTMTKKRPKNRKLFPHDIKNRQGEPLCEKDLEHVWIESHKLGRRINGLEMLNLQASLVKPVYDEASEYLTQIQNEINAMEMEAEGTFRWQRLETVKRKIRGFYNTSKQVWAVRNAEFQEWKRSQEEQPNK